MSCGEIAWWRQPDTVQLAQRYGNVEHLLVQFDFLLQVARLPRVEFSIENASKSGSGRTGYADVVDLSARSIWEIKPYYAGGVANGGMEQAVKEANSYVLKANAACGGAWQLGSNYQTRNGNGIVFEMNGNGNTAQLEAFQPTPGAILYVWRINGQRVTMPSPEFLMGIRDRVLEQYMPVPYIGLPGARPPNDIPPLKWKPFALVPDDIAGGLQNLRGGPELLSACAKMLRALNYLYAPDGGSIAVFFEKRAIDEMFGPSIVARQISNMQVYPDPATLMRLVTAALVVDPTTTLYGYAVEFSQTEVARQIGRVIVVAAIVTAGLLLTRGGGEFGKLGFTPVIAETMILGAAASLAAANTIPAGGITQKVEIPLILVPQPGNPGSPNIPFSTFAPRIEVLPRGISDKVKPGDIYTVGSTEYFTLVKFRAGPDS